MSGELLFLSHRIPFPADRGDKIRSSRLLAHLATLAPVHCATFAETAADLAAEPMLQAFATSHCLVRRRLPLPVAGGLALALGQPVSLTAFRHRRLAAYVAQVLQQRPIAAVIVFSGQMGQYVPADYAGPLLVDFVDVDSAKFEAYGQNGRGPRGWLDRREARLLRQEEARLALRADHSLFVSAEEASLFAERLDPPQRAAASIRVLRNGIDCAWFDPAAVRPEPQMAGLPEPRLIFTGQMDYPPNIAAAERAFRLMPAIRAQLPGASLHIVGRNPPRRLRQHHGCNGCYVWGEVPDIRPWLAAADLALVPLALARGVQNKVLEAMAMALPVVLTPDAACGIGARSGDHLVVAENDAVLVARVVDLARQPEAARALGQRARDYVSGALSWSASLAPLAGWLDLGRGAGSNRAA